MADNQLILFAASRDQARYFHALAQAVDLPITVVRAKALPKGRARADCPSAVLEIAEWHLRRKQNAHRHAKPYWALYRRWVRWQACAWYRRDLAWLRAHPARWVGVWNGKKFRQAVTVAAARQVGKQVVFFERGPLPGYSMIDCFGVNARSGNPRWADFYRQFACENPPQFSPVEGSPPVSQPFVFVPFQVVEDSNIYLHSPHLPDMWALYDWLVQAAEALPELQFVIKPHPACPTDYHTLYERHPRIRFVESVPTQQLVQQAQAVVTINSTVGVEALMAATPVVVLGEALYAIDQLVLMADSPKALAQALRRIDRGWRADEAVRRGFLCYLAHHYALPGDAMRNPDGAHWQAVEKRLRTIMDQGCGRAIGL
ncbi:MAG TPA: hypothetical protein EYH46_02860 [Sulfurivirga caldicuralii]|nr:hypothetical protein [Sulfurivirga caldicuralii]